VPDTDPLVRYLAGMDRIGGDVLGLPMVRRARAILRVLRGEDVAAVGADLKLTRFHLGRWVTAVQADGFYDWLGREEPAPDRLARARGGIAQMLLGLLAEQHFEGLARGILGEHGFGVKDDRVGRTDTDYLLVDRDRRPVCRFNIKFHGTLFRESPEYVGLPPEDCFPLATYKIHGALRRQDAERVPYVFLIVSVPDFPRADVERSIGDEDVWLAALSDRNTEEAIVRTIASEPWVGPIRDRIQASEFRALSARRADRLLRDLMFERVHALRLRGFNRTFRGAEINMHLSLSREMIAFTDFLRFLADNGVLQLTVSLDRGDF
jgi:hypothetical protein